MFAVREALESLVVMLTPFAPHVAEEMWEGLGHAGGLLSEVPRGRLPILSLREAKSWRFRCRSTANCVACDYVAGVSEDELRAAALADERCKL